MEADRSRGNGRARKAKAAVRAFAKQCRACRAAGMAAGAGLQSEDHRHKTGLNAGEAVL